MSECSGKSDPVFYAERAGRLEDWEKEKHARGIATHLETVHGNQDLVAAVSSKA